MLNRVTVFVTKSQDYLIDADSTEELNRIIDDAVMSRTIEPNDDTTIRIEHLGCQEAKTGQLMLFWDDDDKCARIGRVLESTGSDDD